MARRLILALLVAGTVAAGAAIAWWWFTSRPQPRQPLAKWPVFVTTRAGNGTPGQADGIGSGAMFSDPFGVALAADGVVFVSDAGESNCIRRIDADGTVTTVAGGRAEGYADGEGAEAVFHTPSGLALAPDGALVIADTGNHRIRRMTPDGRVTTVAGDGVPGHVDGPASTARFDGPIGVAVAPDGTIVVADTYNDCIRTISLEGIVTTLAGRPGTTGLQDGPSDTSQFDTPSGVAVGGDGRVFVADTGNDVVRQVDPDGTVRTLGITSLDIAGAVPVPLERPVGITFVGDQWLYVTDGLGRVVVLSSETGQARVLAGSSPGFEDGEGAKARFNAPAGIAATPDGIVHLADSDNYLVRVLTPEAFPRLPGDRFLTPLPLLSPAALDMGLLRWPVGPQDGWHEVTATLGEARGSYGGDGRERLHAGVDVHAPPGTLVLAIRNEKVTRPIPVLGVGDLNEMVRVGLVNYVHVNAGRDRYDLPVDARFRVLPNETGRADRVRLRRGTRFGEGDPIGTVNRFAHVHLGLGPRNAEVNPLLFGLPLFSDHVPPTIPARGIRLLDESGEPFQPTKAGTRVSGLVSIVVEAYDQADGNRPRRRLGVYSLGYQVLHPDGAPAPGFEQPVPTMVFDRLPSTPNAGRLAYDAGSGITVYGSRTTRFRYIVTNEVRRGEAREGWWDTSVLAPGPYLLRVVASDLSGNSASRDVKVIVDRETPPVARRP